MEVENYLKIKNELNFEFNKLYIYYQEFISIKNGDKPYFNENNLIKIDKKDYLQCFNRWYYQRDRYEFFKKFETIFNDLIIFYKNFLQMKNSLVTNTIGFVFFMEEINKIENFIKEIKNALESLKITYQDETITQIINNLILKL